MLLYVGYAVACCPFASAVHRRILLGEAPSGYYAAAVAQRTQRRFLLATIAVYALFFAAPFLNDLAVYVIFGLNPFDPLEVSRGYAAQPIIAAVVLAVSLLSYLLAALIATRFTFAFPGIAIERPQASLRGSFAETHGSTWRLFFVFLLTYAVPFVLMAGLYVGMSVIFVVNHPELVKDPEQIGDAMLYSTPFVVVYAFAFIIMMAMIAVTAAAAARAYEIRVDLGLTGVAEVFS